MKMEAEQEPVKLEELVPQESTVKLNGKEYDLRKVNLQDEIWLKQKFSTRKELFSLTDLEPSAYICFRLLKDKKDFASIEEDGFDDEGKPVKVTVTGPERIMRAVHGEKEKGDLLWAVFKTFGLSRPKPSEGVIKDPKQ